MKRELVLSPEYIEFVQTSNKRTQEKLLYTISILETLNPVPTKFVKKLVGTDFYELRVSVDNEVRVILFAADSDNSDKDIKKCTMTMKAERLTSEELQKLRSTDFCSKPGFVKAGDMLAREVGQEGTKERSEFDAKARAWYYGEVLRERRKELGLTQKELADMVGRDRTYINRIEKGETDLQLSSFLRISDALGITLRLEVSLA